MCALAYPQAAPVASDSNPTILAARRYHLLLLAAAVLTYRIRFSIPDPQTSGPQSTYEPWRLRVPGNEAVPIVW